MTDETREREGPKGTAVTDDESFPNVGGETQHPGEDEALQREGLEAESRSLWKLFRRRFFRHRLAMVSLVVFLGLTLAGLFADYIAPYAFEELDLANRDSPPTLEGFHIFGTDQLGRDYFSRVLYGTGTSVRVAVVVSILSVAIGTIVGAVAGYYRGWIDNVLMRFVDLVLSVPFLAGLLTLVAFLGRGSPYRVAVIIALLLWTTIARIVRGSYLSLREKEFVEAAKASGASDARIIFRHMLPNTLGPIIVNATLTVALAIQLEAVLSFLGFGIQPPTPALGKLIDDGSGAMLTSWWLVVMPGLTIVVLCLAINFIGDGLRDALDPTQAEK